MKSYYDIKLPDNIDDFTLKAIEEGEKYKKRLTIRRKNTSMAAAFALVVLLGVSSTTFAKGYISNVFNTVKDFITIRGDNKEAVGVNITAEDNGVSITVQEVMCDDIGVYASFIVKSEKPFINIKDNQLLMSEHSNVSFTDKPVNSGIMKGRFLDDYTFVGLNTYLFTGIDTKIPKNFTLDLDINAVKLNGTEDGMENIVLGNWKVSVPVELNGDGVRAITPNIKEKDIVIKRITLSKLHTKIEAELPTGYTGKHSEIVTDKGLDVKQSSLSINEIDGKVQMISIFGGIPEDTKYITIGFENLNKIKVDLKKKYKQVEVAADSSAEVEKNTENEDVQDDWLYTKTKDQLPVHEYSGLFSYSYKFTSNKGDVTRYTLRKENKLQHIYVTNEGKRLEI